MAHFVFTLSRDDVDSATRCFQFAKVAHDKGHQVDLFFFDDGVLWADKTRDIGGSSPTGDSPGEYLPYLVDNEIPIGVWPPCASARQVDEANFYPNMAMDGAPHLIDLAADARLFNF